MSAYEDERNAREARNRAEAAEQVKKLGELAQLLGLTVGKLDYRYDGYLMWVDLESPTIPDYAVRVDPGARFGIRGKYHKGGDHVRNDTMPGITIDGKKSAAQMAKDIERRFIPAYNALFNQSAERFKSATEYAEARDKAVAELMAAAGSSGSQRGRESTQLYVSKGTNNITFLVSKDSVSISGGSLTLGLAKLLASLIAAQPDKK